MALGRPKDEVEAVLEKRPEQATEDEYELVEAAFRTLKPGERDRDFQRRLRWSEAWRARVFGTREETGTKSSLGLRENDPLRPPPLWSDAARDAAGQDLEASIAGIGQALHRQAAASDETTAVRRLQRGLNLLYRADGLAGRGPAATQDQTTQAILGRFRRPGARLHLAERLKEDGVLGEKTASAARRAVAGQGSNVVHEAIAAAAQCDAPAPIATDVGKATRGGDAELASETTSLG